MGKTGDKVVCPVIIPSYEPDERLLSLLSDLNKAQVSPVIIVDDGSSDAYRLIFEAAAKEYCAIVLRHENNCGKGRGLKTAFDYCLRQYSNMIGCITADCDGQHTFSAILKCKESLVKNQDKLILGVRNFSGGGQIVPAKSSFGNQLTRKVFRFLYGVDISDTQTGLRGIPVRFMKKLLEIQGERFEFETRMLVAAVQEDISFIEIPIETIYDSKDNHSTHFRPIVDSIQIYKVFGSAFGRFVLSSLSSSIIDLLLFHIFCIIFRNSFLGIYYVVIATVGARIISALCNYMFNYFFVFDSKKKHYQSAMRYFILAIAQMSCSAALTMGLLSLLPVNTEVIVKIPVDVLLWFVSYHVQKRYIY